MVSIFSRRVAPSSYEHPELARLLGRLRRRPPPVRRHPCRRRRSGCTPRRARRRDAAISRIASCSEGKSSAKALMATTGRDAMPANDLEMLEQVGRAEMDLFGVLRQHLGRKRSSGRHLVPAGVELERPHRGDDDGGVGHQSRRAALDVEESLGAHVRSESRLGDQVLTGVDPDQVGHHRRVAVGDVAERAGMHEHRRVLEGLQQVGLDRVAHDDGHRPAALSCFGGDRLARRREPDDDPPETRPQVLQRRGQRQHRHDL